MVTSVCIYAPDAELAAAARRTRDTRNRANARVMHAAMKQRGLDVTYLETPPAHTPCRSSASCRSSSSSTRWPDNQAKHMNTT
ncbi:MAG: hypothetical protein ACYTGQ_06150 [Planctomycetota bacterium]